MPSVEQDNIAPLGAASLGSLVRNEVAGSLGEFGA